MRYKIVLLALATTLSLFAQESIDTDTSFVFNEELGGVTIVAPNEVRKMREAAMPVSVLGARQLEGTTNGHGVAMGRYGNKMVYGSANDEYNGFSTVDLTTGEVETKVATVEGFPSFFYSFE